MEITDIEARAHALAALAKATLTKHLEVWLEALIAINEIKNDVLGRGVEILTAVAKYLPSELLPEALSIAREIEYGRADVLAALVERLPPKLVPEALTIAREIKSAYHRARAITALAKHLPEILPYADERAHVLTDLAKCLPELLPEALAAAKEINYKEKRAAALTALAAYSPELISEALTSASIVHLGGEGAVGETFRAIQDVARWWP